LNCLNCLKSSNSLNNSNFHVFSESYTPRCY
jgi:hypothetical protein